MLEPCNCWLVAAKYDGSMTWLHYIQLVALSLLLKSLDDPHRISASLGINKYFVSLSPTKKGVWYFVGIPKNISKVKKGSKKDDEGLKFKQKIITSLYESGPGCSGL